MGTSLRQPTERLAWCLSFLCHLGLIFAFISWAPGVPSPQGSAQRSRPFVWDAAEVITCHGLARPPQPCAPSLRQSRQRAPLRALILSSQLDLLPHEGEKPRETESVCLRGAEPAPWVSESRPTPDGHQPLPGGNRLRLAHPRPRGPAAGTVCGPCGGHSCVFGGGAERGAPGQVPLSSLPSGGHWVPTAREGCSGVHCVPQHSRGHHVEQARPQGH